MFNKVYEFIKKTIKENYKFLLSLIFIFVFFFYELPFVIYRPGGVIDLSKRVYVENGYKTEGTLSMAYVSMMRGNVPFVLASFVLPNWDLVPTKKITFEDESVTDSIKRDHLYLEEGMDNAIISAYKLADKEITIKKINHIVTYIAKEANTDLVLGDVILNINGEYFDNLKDLQNYINTLKKEDNVIFKVLRDNKEIECKAKLYEVDGKLKVGIMIINKYEYETIPKVSIETKESESGSSGGLMTALAIYNSLTENDITKGRKIVGTGTIDINGNVGEIGGVKYKLLGAEKKGASIFLCPLENYEEVKKLKEENKLKIEIISVETLKEAVEALTN